MRLLMRLLLPQLTLFTIDPRCRLCDNFITMKCIARSSNQAQENSPGAHLACHWYLGLIVIAVAIMAGCTTNTPVQNSPVPPVTVSATGRTQPRLDPKHMAHIGNNYYPSVSRAIPEEGICKMLVTIESDGRVSASRLVESSKFPRLDAACEDAFPEDVRFIPATQDGAPVKATVILPIVWCLGVNCVSRLH